MVTPANLLQSVYDELKVVVNSSTSVTNTDEHVGLLNRTKDIQTPFFGFEYDMFAITRGMGGNVRNGDQITDNAGNVTGVEKFRDYELILDLGVVVDGDSPRLRDEYLDDIQAYFTTTFVDHPENLSGGVRRVREESITPFSTNSRDVGGRVTYNIEFIAIDDISLPTADDVGLDIDETTDDVYPEKY